MAVLRNEKGTELYLDCMCHCNDGIRFSIDTEDPDYYCAMTYTNGNFYTEQDESILRVIEKKLKKIWAIIRNKDFYYSDIMMTQKDFEEFRGYINSIGSQEHDSAEWVKDETGIYVCSHCGVACPHVALENVIEYWNCNYCPNCGEPINK